MQTTFFIKLGFWLEGMVARCYKKYVDGKGDSRYYGNDSAKSQNVWVEL